jgi:TPR repeat protein
MAGISVSATYAMASGGPVAMDESAGAMIHAADKYSRGLGARTTGPRRSGPTDSDADTRPGHESASDRGTLPAGFVPVREVKDMALLGWWPLLEDRMSPCFPAKTLAGMQRRSALGDHEAEAWLQMHAQACSGDPEAQRAFGRVCENGSHRVCADLQRAFFWYYRAALQGDVEARMNAERLMQRSPRISPATMAQPLLIYPGRWRFTAHLSQHLRSASVFDLADDGSATGWLLGNSRATLGTLSGAAGDACGDEASAASRSHKSCYRGGWAFDGIGQVLTVIFESEDGERRWRSANWQIELLGCKPGAIFGRDRRMVGYTLEYVPQGAAREE